MTYNRSDKFKKDYQRLPKNIQRKCDKQLLILEQSFRHPSLHTKKMQGKADIWEARVDQFYRFTFVITGDDVYLRSVGPHDVALK